MGIKRLWALALALAAVAGINFNPNPARAQQRDATAQSDATAAGDSAVQTDASVDSDATAPAAPRTRAEILGDQVRQRTAERDAANAAAEHARTELAERTRERDAAIAAAATARAEHSAATQAVTLTARDCVAVATGPNATVTVNCGRQLADAQSRLARAQRALRTALSALDARVTALAQAQEAHGTRLTSLENAERELRAAIARAQAAADHADREAARAHTRIDGVEVRVGAVENGLREVRTIATRADTNATRANTRLDAFPRLGGWIGGGGTLAVTPVGFAAGASAAGGFRLRLSDDWAAVLSGHIGYGALLEADRSGVIFGGDISAEVRISDAVRLAFGLGAMSTSTPTSYESGRAVGGNLGTGGMLTARIHAGAFYAQIAGVLQPTLTRDQSGSWMSGGTGAGMFLNVGAALFR